MSRSKAIVPAVISMAAIQDKGKLNKLASGWKIRGLSDTRQANWLFFRAYAANSPVRRSSRNSPLLLGRAGRDHVGRQIGNIAPRVSTFAPARPGVAALEHDVSSSLLPVRQTSAGASGHPPALCAAPRPTERRGCRLGSARYLTWVGRWGLLGRRRVFHRPVEIWRRRAPVGRLT